MEKISTKNWFSVDNFVDWEWLLLFIGYTQIFGIVITMISFKTLDNWLDYIYAIHPTDIDLSLDRVKKVAERLDLLQPDCLVITVGGTNGKGSVVKGLETIYLKAGYQVGTFTTPFLFKHHEQVSINNTYLSDDDWVDAFTCIEKARVDISLTIFEFNTLAALFLFKRYLLDVLILEVGLGGRFDAVNIIDAKLSIVTSIDLDHTDRLGKTREAIAFEKAGIFRCNRFAICGDPSPPDSLIQYAHQINARLLIQEKDFSFKETEKDWSFYCDQTSYHQLPKTKLHLQNMATVLMGVTLLQEKLPVSERAIKEAFTQITLKGRFEIIYSPVKIIYDVAHNPAAIQLLASYLKKDKEIEPTIKTYAVFSMLSDKDIKSSLEIIKESIDEWYVAPLQTKRSFSLNALREIFTQFVSANVIYSKTIKESLALATTKATQKDRIVVFGSFHTVSEAAS